MGEVREFPTSPDSELGFAAPAPLTDTHDVSRFDCGKTPLNDWLRAQASRSEGRSARTYVVTKGNAVVAYYCMSTGAVARIEAPGKIKRQSPEPIPILVIGRLAVDKEFQGQGIGGGLLKDALLRALSVSQDVGVRAIVVHAIDQDAVPFYTPYGFRVFPNGSQTLFLAIEDVIAAL